MASLTIQFIGIGGDCQGPRRGLRAIRSSVSPQKADIRHFRQNYPNQAETETDLPPAGGTWRRRRDRGKKEASAKNGRLLEESIKKTCTQFSSLILAKQSLQ